MTNEQDLESLSNEELARIAGVSLAPSQPSQPQRQPQAATQSYSGRMPSSPDEVFGSLIAQESRGRAGAVGPDTQWGNALGRTQMLPSTARGVARNLGVEYREDLLRGTSPEAAAYQDRLGRGYLQEAWENTDNPREALMYYHGGPDRGLWGPKTRAYADEVLAKWASGDSINPTDMAASTDDLEAMSDEELMAVAGLGGDAEAAPTGEPTVDENGFLIAPPEDRWGTEQNPWTEESLTASDGDAKPGDYFRFTDSDGTHTTRLAVQGMGQGEVRRLSSGLAVRETGALQNIGAGALAASEQLPFMQDTLAMGQAALRGQSMDEARQHIRDVREADRLTDQDARNVGGVAGFGLGLLAPGAGYISRGASGVQRMQRAAQVGAGYGALYGAGTSEGSALERLRRGGEGAAIGAVSGGLLQGGIDRIANRAARPASAARRLSREGVELTPGMMLQETPVIGPLAKYGEDLASGYIPFIEGARERSAQSLGRAVGNRSLAPIGEQVSRGAETGYELASDVYNRLGAAYDDVLPRVNAQADWELALGLNDIAQRAATDLPVDHASRLGKILDEGVVDRFTAGGALDGETFKRMETRLREASQRYQKGSVDDQILADYLDEARDSIRGMIARQNPAEAERISDINRGYANYARMRRATRGPAQMTREGTFTPGELSNAVNQLGTEQQLATRSALMQDLAADARNILPSSMGNTGSGQRAVIGMAALGGGAMVNPAIPIAALAGGAALYSAPAQKAINAVYRATDSRAANEGMQTLLELARRDPALVPVYQQILDDLTGRYGETQPQQPTPRTDVLSQAQAGMPVQ